MARVPTGIPGLDELIQGGFLEGAAVLLSGGTGTGKTILALQYIYKGAEQYGEPGIYIMLEEGPTSLWWNVKNFRWNLQKYEQEKLIKTYRVGVIDPQEFAKGFKNEVDRIEQMVLEMNAKRLVIDSTTAFAMWMGSDQEVRRGVFTLADRLKDLKCTTIMTAETLGGRDQYSRFGVEEFVADGVIVLYFIPPNRALFVRKMRGTKHDQKIHPYSITDNGVEVNSREEILWESLGR